MKFASLYVNVFGKYRVVIRLLSKGNLKIIKEIDYMSHIRAKNLLVSYGVNEQEADMAILHIEEIGHNHVDFTTEGRIGYTEFTGINH